jgi:hypothetical protein
MMINWTFRDIAPLALLIGSFASSFVAWLLVPAWLPFGSLTPIMVAGPSIGLFAGGVLVRFRSDSTPAINMAQVYGGGVSPRHSRTSVAHRTLDAGPESSIT